MRMRTTIAALVFLALAPATTGARTSDQRALWATVNVCDTLRYPNKIGIRGSMPGAANAQTLWMRFRVQYHDAGTDKWKFVRQNGDSGFKRVGTADVKARQAGILFQIDPPPGVSFQLRGHVTFQWRKGKKAVRTVTRLTTAGHHSNAGSDPKGYSSDTCVIS